MATPAKKRTFAEVDGVTRAYKGFEKSTRTWRFRINQNFKVTSLTRGEVQSAPISLLQGGCLRSWRYAGDYNEKVFEMLGLRFNCIPSVD
jgi:hypothetical protein